MQTAMLVSAAVVAHMRADPMESIYHTGKLVSLAGVFMKDMLHLRLLTLIGSICSLAYFFTRRPIVWGAIFWGMVFGFANLNMILRLLLERMKGLRLSPEEYSIYRRHFSKSGVTLQQFHSLVSGAERREVPTGTSLRGRGVQLANLMLLLEGDVAICWGEDLGIKRMLSGGEAGNWIGEMGFLMRWYQAGSQPSYSQVIAKVVTRTPCKLLVWSDDEMRRLLNADVELRRSMLLFLGDTRFMRMLARSRSDEYASMLVGILKDGVLAEEDRGMANEYRLKHNISPWEHEWHVNQLGWTMDEWSAGATSASGRADDVISKAVQNGPVVPTAGAIIFNDYSQSFSELGPFHPVTFTDADGVVWPSVQHYIAVQRHPSRALQEEIHAAADAHALRALLRERRFAAGIHPSWPSMREELMLHATRLKFEQDPRCAQILARTGSSPLIFNHPSNAFWGCGGDGRGRNCLGAVLQQVRAEIQAKRRTKRSVLRRLRFW